MTHIENRNITERVGITYTTSGKVPYERTYKETYIKWDLREDWQRIIKVANLILIALRLKRS